MGSGHWIQKLNGRKGSGLEKGKLEAKEIAKFPFQGLTPLTFPLTFLGTAGPKTARSASAPLVEK
jgi:hypothetical protein